MTPPINGNGHKEILGAVGKYGFATVVAWILLRFLTDNVSMKLDNLTTYQTKTHEVQIEQKHVLQSILSELQTTRRQSFSEKQ